MDKKKTELTKTAIVVGVVLAVLFGGANAYLGLRVGMTVSASIPAAVISMGVIRILLKRESVLENNMVQTIGSAGESLAAGAIFTIPALFMWSEEFGLEKPSFIEIFFITLCGGLLGVFFMVPLRKILIVKEEDRLPYPEGTACAKVLMAAENVGESITVFAGLLIGALYKWIADGLKLFPSEVDYSVKKYKGAGIGADVLPALLGVGYICGPKVSSYLFAGGTFAWFVLMPLLVLAGEQTILYPATDAIGALDTWGIWSNYIRYIGAGAVATGGIISLVKSLPMIGKAFSDTVKGYRKKDNFLIEEKNDQWDMSFGIVIIGIIAISVLLWVLPMVPVNFFGAIIIVIFGFFFATVSSRMVGLVGSSNNPVSGMAIATLLSSTFLLKAAGNTGIRGMIASICIGTVICIVAAMSGDTSQDLKTGYLVGATPIKQQVGEIIGVVAAAFTIGGVLYLFHAAWGYGSTELPAPQATLMKMVVEGVMEGNLPWNLVYIGVAVAIVIEILQIPVLPFAVGLYLPIHLSVPIMLGGLLRLVYNMREKKARERGILYASGLIAGEGLAGILLAVCAMIPLENKNVLEWLDCSKHIYLGNAGAIVFFGILIGTMIYFMERKIRKD
ncbi:MAG: oligopeptide transporter, OPT family [Eubacteriales bacterium]|nr:oligopeptide transporter, OPT family [Eubacteriales bacterium]